MASKTPLSLASQVACLASDAVYSLGPHSLPIDSQNGRVLTVLPAGADPLPTLLHEIKRSALLSLILPNPDSLLRILPSISALTASPIVIHVLTKDLSDALAFRSVAPTIIHSSTSQSAYDHALVASRLARSEKRLVLHVISSEIGFGKEEVVEIEEEVVKKIILGPNEESALEITDYQSTTSLGSRSLYDAWKSASAFASDILGRPLEPVSYHGASSPTRLIVSLGAASPLDNAVLSHEGLGHLHISLFKPLPASALTSAIPSSVSRIAVLEQVHKRLTKWGPLFLDVANATQSRDPPPRIQGAVLGQIYNDEIQSALSKFISSWDSSLEDNIPMFGSWPDQNSVPPHPPHVPTHETSYTKILSHLFEGRLEIVNEASLVSTLGTDATRPEHALGRVRVSEERRENLETAVQDLVDAGGSAVQPDLLELLKKWLSNKDDVTSSAALGNDIVRTLSTNPPTHPSTSTLLNLQSSFQVTSRWIIGSDAWSYDLGSSGVHHLIASGQNVNILLIDNTPYSTRDATNPAKRKKDVGLYAMNHGDVYVASIAVYSSYSQALQALLEADRYPGPSVVVAYLPYDAEDSPALSILKETKLAVDTGYWPLYRWNPEKERRGGEPFELDSEAVKADLKSFLDRQNHLSQLVRSTPNMAVELVESLGTQLRNERKKKVQQAYDELLNSIDGPPLLILYASDGGNAEKVAKRLSNRAKARGLSTRLSTMDASSIEDLKSESAVAFITSTAGQGEPPQNGRDMFRALNAAVARGDKPFEGSQFRFAVFGMGDSHYWPRAEDAAYYNKPGKDLDARLDALGGERSVGLGLGDDQDADGPETGYKLWEPLLWKSLGVDTIEVLEKEPEPITNENIKIASNYLRGTIAEGLKDTSTGALAPSDGQLTKFHGIYEQDDRDIRDERKDSGLEPAYSFMIRVRMPGGVCDPAQWLAMDRIADERGNCTFKLTTRQTFQFHGVIKQHLKPAIQAINRALLDTIAACGDVNRNVLCSSLPSLSHLHEQTYEFSKLLSEHLLPSTTAYHEIWLDKKLVAGEAVKDFEPLYGPYYLPRKFKIAVAVPPYNDVDIFANDVGFIAIADEGGKLLGFNVTAGGGMGVTHSNKKTYPRTADVLGFCTPEQGHIIAEKIMLVQRDNGNRADRKNARLKYTIDRMGLENFKQEVEKLLGWALPPPRPFTFESNIDHFGWTTDYRGKHHFTMFIENGRVQDEPGKDFKTGLREIAKVHRGKFRLTANQHLILADVSDEDLGTMKQLLQQYGLDNIAYSGLRLSSSACVAFPTCGLAMAESERYLPILIDKVEAICEENGLRNDSIVMRMTGCPNGCARPYIAEIAFVGKAPGSYLMLLGGGYYGQRLNKIYRENVTEPEILAILRPMIKRYALERKDKEKFGDFVIRAGYISATTSGKEWYDGMGGEGEHRLAAT